MGRQILAKNPHAKGIKEKLDELARDNALLDDLWKKKNEDLRNAAKLQVYLSNS